MYHPTDVCADQSLSFLSSHVYCTISMKGTNFKSLCILWLMSITWMCISFKYLILSLLNLTAIPIVPKKIIFHFRNIQLFVTSMIILGSYYWLTLSLNKTGNVRIMKHWNTFMQPLLQWKSNKYNIFWVCVCSHRYTACNAYVPYCHLWTVLIYKIFHTISQTEEFS